VKNPNALIGDMWRGLAEKSNCKTPSSYVICNKYFALPLPDGSKKELGEGEKKG
jgi:hypothetical protein